jgi:hypothetical protein
LGDFNPQKLPSRGLQTLWEWKNRVLLEEYYIFNAVIPPEVELEQSYGGPFFNVYFCADFWTRQDGSCPSIWTALVCFPIV